MSGYWYALQLRPNREEFSAEALRLRRYEVFLPMYRGHARLAGRMRYKDRPLFPGYLFCRSGSESIGRIVTTPGVIRILSLNGLHVPIPDDDIERLQRVDASSVVQEPWRFVPDGTLVRIESGPLASVEGIFACGEEKRHLVLSVTLLQRSVAVRLDESTQITILSQPASMRPQRQV